MNTPVPHRVVLLAALFAGRDLNVCGGDCKSEAVGCQQRLPEKGAGGGGGGSRWVGRAPHAKSSRSLQKAMAFLGPAVV